MTNKIRKVLSGFAILMLTTTALAVPVTLTILFDDFPNETAFGMWDAGDPNIGDNFTGYQYDVGASSPIGFGDGWVIPGDFTGESPGPWTFVWDLAAGDYTFAISDTFGDGICCGFGAGEYSLSVDGVLVGAGGEFGSFEATNFTVPEPGALSLFALGLLGIAAIRRRKISA